MSKKHEVASGHVIRKQEGKENMNFERNARAGLTASFKASRLQVVCGIRQFPGRRVTLVVTLIVEHALSNLEVFVSSWLSLRSLLPVAVSMALWLFLAGFSLWVKLSALWLCSTGSLSPLWGTVSPCGRSLLLCGRVLGGILGSLLLASVHIS
jgi:hypothetical protein